MAEVTPKRPRGNPNLQKYKKPTAPKDSSSTDNTQEPMADEKEEETTTKQPPAEGSAAPTDKLPDDLFSDKIPSKETLPLDGQVKVKDYAALPSEGGGSTPPPKEGETAKPFEESKPGESAPTPGTPAAPAAKPLTPEEVNTQAGQTVEMMYKGYEKMHQLGRWIGKIDENELSAMHSEGKIDLNITLPIGKKEVSFREFFNDYNSSIESNISVSQKFKDDLRPPLTRIVIKNNLLMSDELFVGMAVADDIVTKTSLLVGLKKSAGMVLRAAVDLKQAIKDQEEKVVKDREKKSTRPEIIENPEVEQNPEQGWHQEPEAGQG